MPSLTASTTFTFGPASPSVEVVTVSVLALPVATAPSGKGRLVHPDLGVLDYDYAPTSWDDIDTDVIVKPTYAITKALEGSATTLWRGALRDAVCVERWDSDAGGLRMRMEMLRTLLLFYTTPVSPVDGYVEWHPTYATDLAFKVALVALTVGGNAITLDSVATHKGWARRDVVLTLKILGRLD